MTGGTGTGEPGGGTETYGTGMGSVKHRCWGRCGGGTGGSKLPVSSKERLEMRYWHF